CHRAAASRRRARSTRCRRSRPTAPRAGRYSPSGGCCGAIRGMPAGTTRFRPERAEVVDQRRVWLAVGLSLLLLLLYQELVVRRYQQRRPRPEEQPVTVVPPREPAPAAPGTPAAAAPGALAVAPGSEPGVVVETDVFRAEITATGGRLASLRLKKYRET